MHLGLIPDGNRRYGDKVYGSSLEGYQDSSAAFQMVVNWCLHNSVDHLSVFVFSTENFAREEKSELFAYLETAFVDMRQDKRLAVEILSCGGYREKFPESLRAQMDRVERESSKKPSLRLHLLMGYGGNCEIQDALKYGTLLTAHLPPLDMVLRTGNVSRLSNFLPYQSAYAELFFLKCLFPEITEKVLNESLQAFKKTARRFGT